MSTLDLSQLRTSPLLVGHLPVLGGILDALGIPEVLNEHLPRHSLARVSDADCVVAMVLGLCSARIGRSRPGGQGPGVPRLQEIEEDGY